MDLEIMREELRIKASEIKENNLKAMLLNVIEKAYKQMSYSGLKVVNINSGGDKGDIAG